MALTHLGTPSSGTETLCGWSGQRWRAGLGRGVPGLFLFHLLGRLEPHPLGPTPPWQNHSEEQQV